MIQCHSSVTWRHLGDCGTGVAGGWATIRFMSSSGTFHVQRMLQKRVLHAGAVMLLHI